jgi:hypothetical protein
LKLTLAKNKAEEAKLEKQWAKAAKFTADGVTVVRSEYVGRGIIQFTVFAAWGDCPLGFVWVRCTNWLAKHASIVHCYVNPIARRKGLMSLMCDEIAKEFPSLSSPNGSKFGEPWMRAYGFTYNEERGQWEYRRAGKKPAKA